MEINRKDIIVKGRYNVWDLKDWLSIILFLVIIAIGLFLLTSPDLRKYSYYPLGGGLLILAYILFRIAFFYFLFVCLMPFYLKRKIEKKLDGHPLLETPIDFEFSPEGMNIIVHQDKKVIFWSQVHSIQNTTSAFLIYGTPHSFFYIVKSEMPTSDLKRLEEWMRASSKLV